MDNEFYNFVNADVVQNKEIQKLTGLSPAKQQFEDLQLEVASRGNDLLGIPKIQKGTFFKILFRTFYWKMVIFCAKMESIKTQEFNRGYQEGRDFEFRMSQIDMQQQQQQRQQLGREQSQK